MLLIIYLHKLKILFKIKHRYNIPIYLSKIIHQFHKDAPSSYSNNIVNHNPYHTKN